MNARIHIEYRKFRCPDNHEFRAAVKSVHSPDRSANRSTEDFYLVDGTLTWLPFPKCPVTVCDLIGEELLDPLSVRSFAQVPAAERFYAWLSPDGERVSVPGYRGAKMPERYKRAGYTAIEASSGRDLDRIKSIRARQTGNEVWSEMDYSPETRAARQSADYTDDATKDI